jgi:hypothetical protein
MLNVSTNVQLYDREPTDGEHQWSRNQSMNKMFRWKHLRPIMGVSE